MIYGHGSPTLIVTLGMHYFGLRPAQEQAVSLVVNLYWLLLNAEAAQKDLRKRGVVLASIKSSRTAAKGLLALAQNENEAAVIELNCETDFVARNQVFQAVHHNKSPSSSLCRPDQRLALLQFKSSFIIHFDEYLVDPHSKVWTWKAKTDCCSSWEGVTCDNFGYVIGLDVSQSGLVGNIDSNNSLFSLHHLQTLNLASNNFQSTNTQQMFHLPNLEILDLSHNDNLTGSLPEFPQESTLQKLNLGYTKFSGHIPHSIGNLKQLTYFEVNHCGFSGPLPHSLGDLAQLAFLDLSSNNFEGEIPFSFSKLSRLKILDMSVNRFVGPLPSLKASCKTIELIDLSSNKFSGPIPSSYYANNGLPNLTNLDLSNNQLNGTIPSSLFTLPSLQIMILYENKFIVILDDEAIPDSFSSPLEELDLSHNLLEGNILKFISKFTSLRSLSLKSINFHGVIDPRMFASFKNLAEIDLSGNNMLSIDTSDIAITIPSLSTFSFSSCNLSVFPKFLRYQSVLYILDLSNNQIQGKIPEWLWNNLEYVYLSNNSLVGFEDPFSDHFSSSLQDLDLSSNNFEGSLPIFPKGMDRISLSKNKFTGAIPSAICNTRWSYIDLSQNQMSGEIPSCLFNSIKGQEDDQVSFSVVDLSKNKLQGIIPDKFGAECWLEGLNLNGNQLEGPLPRSLANCRFLKVLDVGSNQINDTFPFWLGHLESLQVLMLQSNKFHGSIWRHRIVNSSFEALHIIGLSANSFTGHLPLEYFSSSYFKGQDEMMTIKHHNQLCPT
ncbi:hypothetical protein Sjap_021328 [Stephania japonica]|uniref:Leucine-rich repeat-containing N-terminal plant-type domain-containing protein n=1 Tax=Stephania japonica TaxID=461633 RepID=A0AAP0EM80_9MAGN